MFLPRWARAGIFLAGVVACGSSDATSDTPAGNAATNATVSGTVTGKSLAPVEAFARKSNLYTQGDISIYLSSRGGICDVSKLSPEFHADTTFLEIDLPRGWPPPLGTYPIVSSIGTNADGGITMGAFAHLIATDAACKYMGSDDDGKALEGGTVTIESATDSLATGKFDLKFPKGALQGTFSVPLCDIAYPSGSPKTCQH